MAFGVAAFSMVSNLIGEAPAQDAERSVRTATETSEEGHEEPVTTRARRTATTHVLLDRIGRLIRVLTLSAYLITLPLVVLGLLFPNMVLSVFTSEQATMEGAVNGLRVVLLSMLLIV